LAVFAGQPAEIRFSQGKCLDRKAGVLNPVVPGASAGVDTLIAAYLAPGALAVLACRKMPDGERRLGLGVYAVIVGLTWIAPQIREWFLSFLGLELASIGLAAVYRRFVLPWKPGQTA
jgi:hypothetical protein